MSAEEEHHHQSFPSEALERECGFVRPCLDGGKIKTKGEQSWVIGYYNGLIFH